MKLSTRGRYGTRALLELALHQGEGPVLLRDIAQKQEISLSYLEHLITPLIAAGLVLSTRGPKGGVTLARAAEEIRLNEIIHLLDGPIAPVECISSQKVCARSGICAPRDIWEELRKAINDVLASITLQGLVEKQRAKEGFEEIMYYI